MITTTVTQTFAEDYKVGQTGDYAFLIWNYFFGTALVSDYATTLTYGRQNGLGLSDGVFNIVSPATKPATPSISTYDWGFSGATWVAPPGISGPAGVQPPISNIKHLAVTFSTTLTGETGANYDEMIDTTTWNAMGLSDNEISILTSNWIADPHPTGTPFSIDGITGYFESHPESIQTSNSEPNKVEDSFHITSPMLSGTVDYVPFFQYLEQLGLLSPTDTMGRISLFSETDKGSNTLTINSFSVFDTVMNPLTITQTAKASAQVFSITSNNNYAINGAGFSDLSTAINSSFANFTFSEGAVTTSSSYEIDLSAPGYGSIATTGVQTIQFNDASVTVNGSSLTLNLTAGTMSNNIDAIQQLVSSKQINSIMLTDSATPTLSIAAAQLSADATALNDISSNYALSISPGTSSVSIGGLSGHAATVDFTGNASQYTVSTANGAVSVTLGGVTDRLSNIAAIQFADFTEIVAATPGPASAVTTGNVTELYSAVLAREPDVGGLTFYKTYLQNNPSTPLQQFATWFLDSTEYTSAHNYAQSTAGDTQFTEDSYQNLLHRTPSASELSFYETNVLAPAVTGLTAGTAVYANAQLQAHALMLVYFSASAEFLSDVQVTATTPPSAQHWLILA